MSMSHHVTYHWWLADQKFVGWNWNLKTDRWSERHYFCFSNRSSWNPGSWCSCVCSLTHKTHSNIVSDKITPHMATSLHGSQFVKASPIYFNLILIGSGAFWGQMDTSSCFLCSSGGTNCCDGNLKGVCFVCKGVWLNGLQKDSGFPSRVQHCNEKINVYHFNCHWCWPGCNSKHRDW